MAAGGGGVHACRCPLLLALSDPAAPPTHILSPPAAKEGTRTAAKAFDRWFGTPKLVRETSRRPLVGRGAGPKEKSMEEVKRDFSDIVLEPQLQVGVGGLLYRLWGVRGLGSIVRGCCSCIWVGARPELQLQVGGWEGGWVGALRICIVDFEP